MGLSCALEHVWQHLWLPKVASQLWQSRISSDVVCWWEWGTKLPLADNHWFVCKLLIVGFLCENIGFKRTFSLVPKKDPGPQSVSSKPFALDALGVLPEGRFQACPRAAGKISGKHLPCRGLTLEQRCWGVCMKMASYRRGHGSQGWKGKWSQLARKRRRKGVVGPAGRGHRPFASPSWNKSTCLSSNLVQA